MRLAVATAAVTLLSLAAPSWASDLEGRRHGFVTTTVHDLSVSTTTTTVFATVTIGGEVVAPTQPPVRAQENNQVTTRARTRTKNRHRKPVTKEVTETQTVVVTRDQVVTKTITEDRVVTKTRGGATVTATQVVEHTVLTTATEDFTTTVEEPVTITVTEEVEETETTTQQGQVIIQTNNNEVDTETVVETSTVLVTTVVDGATTVLTSTEVVGTVAATETDTTESAAPTEGNGNGKDDPQTSLTLDPRVIQPGLALTGQETPTPGQVESLTTTNNFINFCLTQDVPLTDGQQIRTGSCNVVPMGMIIAKDKIPSAKFVFPPNFGTVEANKPFTVKLKLKNLQAGAFTNAQLTYYGAPATVNNQGIAIGHSHVVIEKLPSLDTTEPLDPTTFAFFKGLNAPLDGDSTLSTTLDKGLDAGFYRMFSINTSSNHQPVLASVAQHGSMDDGVYFTVA